MESLMKYSGFDDDGDGYCNHLPPHPISELAMIQTKSDRVDSNNTIYTGATKPSTM